MVFKKMRKIIANEQGQSVIEYIMILLIVVLIAMKFRSEIGRKVGEATEKLGVKIDEALDADDL